MNWLLKLATLAVLLSFAGPSLVQTGERATIALRDFAQASTAATVALQAPSTPFSAPLPAFRPYVPAPNTDVLSDGVVGVTLTNESFFGIPIRTGRGTAFYVSPELALTAEHVTAGNTGSYVSIDGQVFLRVSSEAPTLDVTLLTPHRAMLTATVAAKTPLPTVYHPLLDRRPAVGEQFTALCRYDARAPITPVVAMVTNSRTTILELFKDGSTRPVPGMTLRVLSGDSHEGCSGAPLVDGDGHTLGVVVTGDDAGDSMGVVSSVDIRACLRGLQVPGY